MTAILKHFICSLVLLAGSSLAFGQSAADDYLGGNVRDRLNLISDELESSFYRTLDDFAREIAERPYDVALIVDRCRFIDEFSYEYEYEPWVDAIYELSGECTAELEADWANHPEVILSSFDYLYGEGLLEAAVEYDYPPNRVGWTEGQLSRLYEALALAADTVGNPNAGAYARRAVDLDARSAVRLIAAESLAADDLPQQALAMLDSPMGYRVPADEPWNATREMALLASLGERERILRLYGQLKEQSEYYDSSAVARVLRDVGEIDLARVEFESAAEFASYDTYTIYELFDFEMTFGSGADAMAAYERWRSTGWAADPLGINRVALFFKDSSLPLGPKDMLGLVGLFSVLLFLATAALLAVFPVHYRGAVLRARHGLSIDTSGWRLRHAWYALFALGLASVVPLYGSGAINLLSGPDWFSSGRTEQLARYFLVEGLLFLALLIPVSRFGRADQSSLTASWSIPKSILIALGVALLFRVPFFLYWTFSSDGSMELISNSLVLRLTRDVAEQYGVLVALGLIAVVAPVAEEIAFRGVLLRSFSKNVSFALANTLQAAMFSLMHVDLPAAPMLFALGLIAGLLARRSGGLLAPVAMHAVFNLIIGLYVLM